VGDERVIGEALRLHQRYAAEIVERFELCPWARHARAAGELVREVLLQRDEALAPSLEAIRRREDGSRAVAVAILLYPRLRVTPRRFEEFVARLRDADQARSGGRPAFVAASFHPDYALRERSPASLVPFFRRSPDPSIQLVRLAVLDEARGGAHGKFLFDFSDRSWAELKRRQEHPSVTERITADNAARLRAETPARLEAIYADILADRDRTYASLGETPIAGP
jgi:hypothetical protein